MDFGCCKFGVARGSLVRLSGRSSPRSSWELVQCNLRFITTWISSISTDRRPLHHQMLDYQSFSIPTFSTVYFHWSNHNLMPLLTRFHQICYIRFEITSRQMLISGSLHVKCTASICNNELTNTWQSEIRRFDHQEYDTRFMKIFKATNYFTSTGLGIWQLNIAGEAFSGGVDLYHRSADMNNSEVPSWRALLNRIGKFL